MLISFQAPHILLAVARGPPSDVGSLATVLATSRKRNMGRCHNPTGYYLTLPFYWPHLPFAAWRPGIQMVLKHPNHAS